MKYLWAEIVDHTLEIPFQNSFDVIFLLYNKMGLFSALLITLLHIFHLQIFDYLSGLI